MKAADIEGFADLLYAAETQARSTWEMNFCDDMRNRYDRYGDDTLLSEPQAAKLRSIAGEDD